MHAPTPVAATALENLPATHASQVELDDAAADPENDPARHSTHVDSSVAPGPLEYLPASHDQHAELDDRAHLAGVLSEDRKVLRDVRLQMRRLLPGQGLVQLREGTHCL